MWLRIRHSGVDRGFNIWRVGVIESCLIMDIGALIPVKGFNGAKQRLSSRLSMLERSDLMKAMVHDVLAEVGRVGQIQKTYIVTGSTEVESWVSAPNVEVIREREETGQTDAVHFGFAVMKAAGMGAALVLPGDIPLLRAEDIESVLRAAPKNPIGPFAVLVPSHDYLGTNALLLAPPDILSLRFGYDSYRHHLHEAATHGIPVSVVENSRIGLDIDEPSDLQQLIQRLDGGNTYDRLAAMKYNGSSFFTETE